MPRTVVIADDITGADDIGIMYAKAGLKTLVYSFREEQKGSYGDCDVLVLDTDSRFDSGERAYEKVQKALKSCRTDEVKQYIDKQCSVFRGNIGAEFDAMLDELGENFAVVVLGFPDNGRTTLHSLHYVHGTLLEESQFRKDPVHPMMESDLRKILKRQTKRPVNAIHYEVYEQGKEAVSKAVEEARRCGGYCIMDVRDNRDLILLAEVLKEEKVLCGSSALSEYLAKVQEFPKKKREEPLPEEDDRKVLGIAGSLTPQTIKQTGYIKDRGYPVIELDTMKILSEDERKNEIQRILTEAEKAYEIHSFVLIHSMNEENMVRQTKKLAADAGMDNTQVSTLVSETLSVIARELVQAEKIRKLIVCGGDTSAALCAGLEIEGMEVRKEIEPGLPVCQSVTAPFYKLVLKSGSFGAETFIEKALDMI